MHSAIQYRTDVVPPVEDIARVFSSAGLSRPTQDLTRLRKMFTAASLVVSAWDGGTLVGIGRALTDFCYCCYLSDLAVDSGYQKLGIGRQMIARIREAIGDECSLMLLAAKGAMGYYHAAGFEKIENGFIIRRMR